MATLDFRIATADDVARLHPLVESAYRGDESRLGWTTEADLLAGARIDTEGLLAKITDTDSAVLIATCPEDNPDLAESARPVIACCELVRRTAKLAYFGMFAVSPRRQGGGIGRQVLAAAEDHCRKNWGSETMEMKVIASRAELIAWYGRRGYRVTGESRAFPFDELAKAGGVALKDDLRMEVMAKDLRAVAAEVSGNGSGVNTPIGEVGKGGAAALVVADTRAQ